MPELATRKLFEEVQPGDRIEVTHEVKVGMQVWQTVTAGTVVSKDRRRHGLHFRRNVDDKVYSDILVLRRDDGELTTATIDEFTGLKRLASAVTAS
jgi:hypothetical protein